MGKFTMQSLLQYQRLNCFYCVHFQKCRILKLHQLCQNGRSSQERLDYLDSVIPCRGGINMLCRGFVDVDKRN